MTIVCRFYFCLVLILFSMQNIEARVTYEINGSPFAVNHAPLPRYLATCKKKCIYVDPIEHVWGAYNQEGKLIRWGIATAGAMTCLDSKASCRTKSGEFRIYAMGDENCISRKYNDAPMPYCMYFHGSEALHGSTEISFANVSHGCVRIHVADAKWLRYHFAESPNEHNHYRGTKMIIKAY